MHKRKLLSSSTFLVIFFLLFLSFIPHLLFAQKDIKRLTIERIFDVNQPSLSGTFPTNINWMPDGKNFIYAIQNKENKKYDLWKFDCEKGKATILLENETLQKSYEALVKNECEKNNKISLQNYILSPDGNNLLFSLHGDLYFYNAAQSRLDRLTASNAEEKTPAFSPDGRYVAYTRDNNIYVLELSSGLEMQLTSDGSTNILNGYLSWVYWEELYTSVRDWRAFWWSPDSRYIAFYRTDESPVFTMTLVDHVPFLAKPVLQKYPKAGEKNPLVKIGVASIPQRKTTWLDTSSDEEIYIARLKWLPQGNKLIMQTLNRDQTRLQILLADPSTFKTEPILTEEQKTWVVQTDNIYFMPEKKEFISTSDKSGWRHLNLYDFNNNIKSRLTNGKWQVSSLHYVDEENGWIYFTANEKSSLENHLYRIKMDGSGFERLSKEEGWHTINICPTGEYYIDTYSTIMVPPRMDLSKFDGTKLYTIEENKVEELSQYRMSAPEFFTIPTEDGKKLPAMMIKPPNFNKTKKYPVIFTIYGGPESLRVANRWGSRRRTLWYQLLADQGFIVLAVENRCSIHFGKEGANLMHRNLGNWEVEDLKSSVRYMRKLPYVKPNSIGIWGGSYGGYNTCLNMLKAPDYFQVGVAVAPVTDWHDYDTIYTERYMDRPQDNPEGYKRSSTLNYADQLKGKLLIIHGTLDDNVHMQNSVQLAHELIKHNKQFSYMIYPRCGHGFQYGNSQRHLYKLITDYFITHLK